MIGKTFERKKKKLIYRNNAMWQVGKRNKDLSRKAPYVSERPRVFQKGPICFRKDLYVSKEPHMFEKETHMLPICCAF